MKHVSKLAVPPCLVLAFGALLAPAASAAAGENEYVASYREHASDVPAPIAVVTPEASLRDAETENVDVAFVVDTNGRPVEIKVAYASNEALVRPVIEALERWKFEPAVRGGVPVATRVLLPVRFVSTSKD